MPRRLFDQHLRELQDHVLAMGSMVENALYSSMDALKNRDLELAGRVIKEDRAIDHKRFEIEEECIDLIITQQPLASDLRIIIAVLNIIVDLERIGDHAEGIAKISIMIGNEPPLKPLIDLPRMAEQTGSMLKRVLEAFIHHDAESATRICAEDDDIDNLYDQVFRELLTFMAEDPKTITRATRLIWVGHNLERSADRVTNIGERIVYVVTGKRNGMISSRY
ncbi:MAG: phosphate signaling complex protein PhoU [Dehalococcoidales bacterium]|nr:phosphate signaling complex protein PhoU [Dehalococcoidales bacterium]